MGPTGRVSVFCEKNVPPAVSSDPPEMPPYYAQKNEYSPAAGPHLGGRLTCGPTKFTGTEGFVNLVNMNDSSSSDHRCPSNGRSASSTSGLRAPAAQSSTGRAAFSCLPWPAVLSWRPHRPLLLPPLARPSLYSPTPPVILQPRQPHPRTPLRVGIHCCVFPGSASSPS